MRELMIAILAVMLLAPLSALVAAETSAPYVFTDGAARLATPGIEVPFEVPGSFVAGRQIVEGRQITVTLKTPSGTEAVPVVIPKGSPVGRIPLIRKLKADGKAGYAVTEAVYVEFGEALPGEVVVDGDLREWASPRWAPVGEPDDMHIRRFLVSQAIPLALLGIPGIYIHSLLGSRNDYAGVKATGRARSINREQLPLDRLQTELGNRQSRRAKVFTALRGMLELRAKQRAFHPDARQEILDCGPGVFAVRRYSPDQQIVALHNVTAQPQRVPITGTDLLSGHPFDAGNLAGYDVRWITQ